MYKWLTETPFSHRGLHGSKIEYIENTLSAFHAANAKGHGFECDILLSKDNRAMVFHDVDLNRLTDHSGKIQDFTAEQLSKFKLKNSHDTIPTLAKVLTNIHRNYPILIEIKGDQGKPNVIAQTVYEEIQDYAGPLAIMSFYPDILLWFQKNAPNVPRGLVATSINENDMPKEYFSIDMQKSLIDDLNVDFIAYDIKALPNDVTEYCRDKHIAVLTWTVRTEELRQKAILYTDNSIYENLDL